MPEATVDQESNGRNWVICPFAQREGCSPLPAKQATNILSAKHVSPNQPVVGA
jgi:hypothetical protein